MGSRGAIGRGSFDQLPGHVFVTPGALTSPLPAGSYPPPRSLLWAEVACRHNCRSAVSRRQFSPAELRSRRR